MGKKEDAQERGTGVREDEGIRAAWGARNRLDHIEGGLFREKGREDIWFSERRGKEITYHGAWRRENSEVQNNVNLCSPEIKTRGAGGECSPVGE